MTYTLPEPDCGVHYTERQMLEAYAQGQRDMREKAASHFENADWIEINRLAYITKENLVKQIRALHIETI